MSISKQYPHYFKDVSKLDTVDVYRVLKLWGVADPCLQHAIKKLLAAGQRGTKDAEKDVKESIVALTRWVEMRMEEASGIAPAPIPGPWTADPDAAKFHEHPVRDGRS